MPRLMSLHAAYWLLPCLLYLYAAGRAPHARGIDLFDQPDPQEYALLAGRLSRLEPPLVAIGLHEYPSRYSLAYPLLLAPFARAFGNDLTRLHWAPLLFGLVAVGLLARAGLWLLGSRLAGGVAAALFAVHPAVVTWSIVNMSEMALVMVFLGMLEVGRPWLAPPGRGAGPWRAAALGLMLGWLTLCKAPFAYWALLVTFLVFARSCITGPWPGAALVMSGLACAAGELAYRRWAFGSWWGDGYRYWHPSYYTEWLRVFNIRYLVEPVDAYFQTGALRFYGRMLLGRMLDFYGPLAALVFPAAGLAIAWPGRRGRPGWTAVALMTGWLAVGAAFCGLYFFQSSRFLLLWIPVLDLLLAWGLVRIPRWRALRRGRAGRLRLPALFALLSMIVFALLLHGELRGVIQVHHMSPERRLAPLTRIIRPLLARVPEGAWLLTNYNLPIVQRLRPAPGPTVALYSDERDMAMMNCHTFVIWSFQIRPFRAGPIQPDLDPLPQGWISGPSVLIDPGGRFRLDEMERRRLFSKRVYLLLVTPSFSPATGEYFRSRIRPMLERELKLEPVQAAGEVALYRCQLIQRADD